MPNSSRPPPPRHSRPPAGERRRDTRAPIELKVEYKRLNSFFADYTKNLSRDGTFIATERPLPIGTQFVFRLGIPTLDEPMQLNGRVTWITRPESATEDLPAGMGIKFEYQSDDERSSVHAAVLKLMDTSLGPALSHKLLSESAAEASDKKQ